MTETEQTNPAAPDSTPIAAPPPPPPPPPPGLPVSDAITRFERDYRPPEKGSGMFRTVDLLLKHPASLVHDLIQNDRTGYRAIGLAVTLTLCLLGYGAIVGSFSGGQQLLAAPLKLLAGSLLSALICLPSLYIFTALSGGAQSLRDVGALLLVMLSLTGLLLIGFAPIAWLFSQATHAVAFMGTLHLAFWLVATYFGLRLMGTAFAFLNQGRMRILRLWALIFIVVAMQMSTTLRPIVGEPGEQWIQGKKFFLAHWVESLTGRHARDRGRGWM